MSDTCIVRSVKVFIPTPTEEETDLSEGGLCQVQVLKSAMMDQTGVLDTLLILYQKQLRVLIGVAAVRTVRLDVFVNYKGETRKQYHLWFCSEISSQRVPT